MILGITNPPMTHAPVQMATFIAEICFLQNRVRTAEKQLALMAKGVMYIVLDIPFSVIMANVRPFPVHIPKHTVIGSALISPTHILSLQSTPGVAEVKGEWLKYP